MDEKKKVEIEEFLKSNDDLPPELKERIKDFLLKISERQKLPEQSK